jgi:2-keto-4-pentenoate hydratase/2-oxohepta-3-ene-1,7-dioic acid hydratase in catechol pathway
MRLVTYQSSSGSQLGIAYRDEIFPIPDLEMLSFIRLAETGVQIAKQALRGPGTPLESVTLLAPIPVPQRNIFCLGWNYAEHSEESARASGREVKLHERPAFFTKATTTVSGPYSDIRVDFNLSKQIDWEVELAVVIGPGGKNISADKAMAHVFGYTVVNDVSARDLQVSHGGQFFKGKSLDGFCPMGPWIVTRDEIPDPHALRLQCRVNHVTKQDSSTSHLIFNIPSIIEWLSQGLTLLPGDVIATGTPGGVGFARQPPEFLRPGDVVECEAERVGVIRNRIVPENMLRDVEQGGIAAQ